MVNRAVEDLVVSKYGEDTWEAIKQKAHVDVDVFISNEGYPDEMTYRLVGAASHILGVAADDILVAFGEHWVLETAQKGYGGMMASAGRTLKEFLTNLPNFHSRVVMVLPKLHPPRFECSNICENSLHLHYYTHRPGLTSFVIGLLGGLGKMFNSPVKVHVADRKDAGADHDIFEVEWSEAQAT